MAQVTNALLGALMMGVLAGSVMLWWQAFKRMYSGQPILKIQPRHPVPWGMLDLVLIFVIVMLTMLGGQSLAYRVFELQPGIEIQEATVKHLAVSIFSSSLALLASCAVSVAILQLRGATWRDLGVQSRRLFEDVCLGGGAFVMLAPPMYFVQFLLTRIWPSEHPLQTMLLEDPQLSIILGAMFTAVVVAPLTEEIFFRLIFQGWMEKAFIPIGKVLFGSYEFGEPGAARLENDVKSAFWGDQAQQAVESSEAPIIAAVVAPGESEPGESEPGDTIEAGPTLDATNPYTSPQAESTSVDERKPEQVPAADTPSYILAGMLASLVSAFVFAILHWGHGPDPIPLFFLALGLGYLYHRTHRIIPCIVVHFLVNGLSMLALLLFLLSGQEPP